MPQGFVWIILQLWSEGCKGQFCLPEQKWGSGWLSQNRVRACIAWAMGDGFTVGYPAIVSNYPLSLYEVVNFYWPHCPLECQGALEQNSPVGGPRGSRLCFTCPFISLFLCSVPSERAYVFGESGNQRFPSWSVRKPQDLQYVQTTVLDLKLFWNSAVLCAK